MSVVSGEILALANELGEGITECHWRSSVSRAYYAAYHGCRIWHDALPVHGSNIGADGGKHQVLINQLSNPAPEIRDGELKKKSKLLAAQLTALRTQRVAADYYIHQSLDKVSQRNACVLAKQILERLNS